MGRMARPKRNPSEAVKPLLEAGKAINLGELAEELMGAFGGPKVFATTYHKEFTESRTAMARSKMLDGVLRIITQATARATGKGDDIASLTDDELSAFVVDLLKQRGLEAGGAPEEPPTA